MKYTRARDVAEGVSLAEARGAAQAYRKLRQDGIDPIDNRKSKRANRRAVSAGRASGAARRQALRDEEILSHRAGLGHGCGAVAELSEARGLFKRQIHRILERSKAAKLGSSNVDAAVQLSPSPEPDTATQRRSSLQAGDRAGLEIS